MDRRLLRFLTVQVFRSPPASTCQVAAPTFSDGRRLFIEIANTHPCPPEKIEKLDAMGVEVLEITVSSYQSYPLDELDDIILDIAPRKLIHSPGVKAMGRKLPSRGNDRRTRRSRRRSGWSPSTVSRYLKP